jgi:hypothetical protein
VIPLSSDERLLKYLLILPFIVTGDFNIFFQKSSSGPAFALLGNSTLYASERIGYFTRSLSTTELCLSRSDTNVVLPCELPFAARRVMVT